MNIKKSYLYLVLVLGIIDSIYLTIVHFSPGLLVCQTSGVINCQDVLTSVYSAVFGIPIAVLGLIWFLAGFYIFTKGHKDLKFGWSAIGIVAIAYSFSSMALLKAICEYCLALDALIALAILFSYTMKK